MRMGKTVGIAVALLMAFTVPASAQMAKGKVKEVDKAGQAIVLEDGTRLSVTPNWLDQVAPGDPVVAVYSAQGDKKVVTDLDRKTKLMDGSESTNLGAR
jgi:hypothetical protein